MKARWGGTCPKCETVWVPGDTIKPYYVRRGFTPEGKPVYERVPKQYVHAPRCPKPKPPPDVDPRTGEILVRDSAPLPHQESLL